MPVNQLNGSGSDESNSVLLPVQVENLSALDEDELHDLVLVRHVDGHVSCVVFRPHQRRAKYNTDTLSGHQVLLRKSQNPENNKSNIKSEGLYNDDEVKLKSGTLDPGQRSGLDVGQYF